MRLHVTVIIACFMGQLEVGTLALGAQGLRALKSLGALRSLGKGAWCGCRCCRRSFWVPLGDRGRTVTIFGERYLSVKDCGSQNDDVHDTDGQ